MNLAVRRLLVVLPEAGQFVVIKKLASKHGYLIPCYNACMKTWKLIPFAVNYEISSAGDVRRVSAASGTSAGRLLKPMLNPFTGYLEVALRAGGCTLRRRIHRLVAETFLGSSPTEVNHKNGIKTDNRLVNLEYATRRQNHDHAMEVLNVFWLGSRVPQSKLKEHDIATVWMMRDAGKSYAAIGREFGVGHVTILHIIKGRSWRRQSEALGRFITQPAP